MKFTANQFWQWFTENSHKYLFLSEVDEAEKDKLMDEILVHLHAYCDHLYFQIGGDPKEDRIEFVITAEGAVDYFEKVEELADAAPDFPRWKVVKYKQPQGPGFITEYEGKVFDPDKIVFIPLRNEENPEGVGIQVCYPDYKKAERNTFVNGTYLMLDALIGEKSSTLDIDYLDVIKTPKGVSAEHYPVLSSIGELIRERKIYKYPGESYNVIEHTDENGYLTFITANFAYKNFKYTNEFPWFLKIIINVNDYNENGHPEDEEAEILNSFEDFLDSNIKALTIAHYIGRTTLYKKREILYYLQEADKAEQFFNDLKKGTDAIRDFQFVIENDTTWNNVKDILEKAQDTLPN